MDWYTFDVSENKTSLIFKASGHPSEANITKAKAAFVEAVSLIEERWKPSRPIQVLVEICDDTFFRKDEKDPPGSWRYCFLGHFPLEHKVLCNSSIFDVLPNDAEVMIKHELSHAILALMVGRKHNRKSLFMREGMASIDDATVRLKNKIRELKLNTVPSPFSFGEMEITATNMGDNSKEPFICQLNWLVVFSAGEFLRKRNGEQKMLDVWTRLDDATTLEDAYRSICNESIENAMSEWRESIL